MAGTLVSECTVLEAGVRTKYFEAYLRTSASIFDQSAVECLYDGCAFSLMMLSRSQSFGGERMYLFAPLSMATMLRPPS